MSQTKPTRDVKVPGESRNPESNNPDQPNDLIDGRAPVVVQEQQRVEHTSDARHKGDSMEALLAKVEALEAENQRLKSANTPANVPTIRQPKYGELPKAADLDPAELSAATPTQQGWIVPEPAKTVTITEKR